MVKLKAKFTLEQIAKAQRGSRRISPSRGWLVISTPRPLYPRERPGTHCIGGYVGSRAGLNGCGKSRPPTGIRSLDHPARSESLYRLSYRGRRIKQNLHCNCWNRSQHMRCLRNTAKSYSNIVFRAD